MKICGLQKTTLLDFPGHVAATVFLNGCNFRCPFCHNGDLLSDSAPGLMTEGELLDFLKKRRGMLEGVCITGGEPTLHLELESLIRGIKELGYLVKLDTNGYRPAILKSLVEKGLLDYVAMDIKAGRARYGEVAGRPGLDIGLIGESADFLLHGTLDFEFRTTVAKELLTADDFEDIARWLDGCPKYFLQNYTDSDQVLTPGLSGCTKDELLTFASILRPHMGTVELRGIDY